MKNTNSPQGERAFSLPELKAKEAQLEASLEEVRDAIHAFEKLVKSGVMHGQDTPKVDMPSLFDLGSMSVY